MTTLIEQLTCTLAEVDQVRIIAMNLSDAIRLLMGAHTYSSLIDLASHALTIEERLKKTSIRVKTRQTETRQAANDNFKPRENRNSNRVCYNCGSPSHLKAQCPEPRKAKAGQGVSSITSTGAIPKGNAEGMQ